MSIISTFSKNVVFNSVTRGGTILLPLTQSNPQNRILGIKDGYGNTARSTVTVSTIAPDIFEDGLRLRTMNDPFGSLLLYTGSTSLYNVIGGSLQNSFQLSTLVVSSFQQTSFQGGVTYSASNLAPFGPFSLLDNTAISSTAILDSTFIELGQLNPLPAGTTGSNTFRWLIGTEGGPVSTSGLAFKVKQWRSFGPQARPYGANASTLTDRLIIDNLGNVGLGVNPSTTLDVASTIRSQSLTYPNAIFQPTIGRFGINTRTPQFGLDVNADATISTINGVQIQPNISSLFVATGFGNTLYSFNGINWAAGTGIFNDFGQAVGYNGKLWVIGGSDTVSSARIKYSFNGISWSNSTGATFNTHCYETAWNGSYWLATGRDSSSPASTIKYSLNGINWSNVLSGGFSAAGYGLAWNGYMWVAVGVDTTAANRIQYSFNGLNWSVATGATFTSAGLSVAWNGRLWVAGGQSTPANTTLKYSYNGIFWFNSAGTGFTTQCIGVKYNGLMFVAVGQDSTQNNTIKYSYDGITWSNSAGTGFTSYGYKVSWGADRWVAVGVDATSNNRIKYSFNGVNWSNSSGLTFNEGYGIGYSSNPVSMYYQQNLDIFPQNVPMYLRSTNTLLCGPSTLTFNGALKIDKNTNRVGIQNDFPRYSLDVAGNAQFSTLTVGTVSSINTSTNQQFSLAVFGAGDVGLVTGTTWTQISDRRVKTDIIDADLERCYSDTKALPLRRFTYIPEVFSEVPLRDRHVLGFLAQDVSTIQPKSVLTAAAFGVSDATWLNVDQIQLSMMGAAKKGMNDTESLTSTAASVERMNTNLFARLSTLSNTISSSFGSF